MERMLLPYVVNGRRIDICLACTLEDGEQYHEITDKQIYIKLDDYWNFSKVLDLELKNEGLIKDRNVLLDDSGKKLKEIYTDYTLLTVDESMLKKAVRAYEFFVSVCDTYERYGFQLVSADLIKYFYNDIPFVQLDFLKVRNYAQHWLDLSNETKKIGQLLLNEETILFGYIYRVVRQQYIAKKEERDDELEREEEERLNNYNGDYPGDPLGEPLNNDVVNDENRIFRAVRNGEGDNYGL